ncbi:MAG: hypothetical protein KBT15_02705 [Bacteroidales bacterium]|nr:hypothetical protein [Candidatus Minthousia equi]
MVEGTTWYIQKLCNEIFAYADNNIECTIADVDNALERVLEEKTETFQDTMARLTLKQRQLLIALSKEGNDVRPTSGAFIKKYKLSTASSIQRSLSSLLDKDIISAEQGKYYIYDYFFQFWLQREI